ncbi:T6SS effector BTH_I2691 family protein [Rahnella perminowiae]|uniref:T6SS effector BTH_I2691 family protein n=2 Tax=Rahnella perminowiae TaxID=2816244 RepID=UPI00300EE172
MSQPAVVICPRCQPGGPAILPVRYAPIPDSLSPKLPGWAKPEIDFPKTTGYDYGLRAMRAGFLYVWYEADAHWETWSITPDGGLWKQNDALSAQPKYTSDCERGFHKSANIEFIVLDKLALTSTLWLAYTPAKWNPALLDIYATDAGKRKARMQQVEPWQWNAPEEEKGIAQATQAPLQTVLDYQPPGPACPAGKLPFSTDISRISNISSISDIPDPSPFYTFAADAVRPRTTLYPWSTERAGKESVTLTALASRGTLPDGTPVKPLIMAVNDPIGIAHELTGWCDDMTLMHKRYRDELGVEFATYYDIKGLERVIRQAEEQQFDQTFPEKASRHSIETVLNGAGFDLKGTTPSYEELEKIYAESRAKWKLNAVNKAWQKYADKFEQRWITDFEIAYGELTRTVEEKTGILIGLRLLWLQHPLFIACIDDFNSDLTQDHLNYREMVGYALASINLSETGKAQINTWADSYSTLDNKNLLWRYQFFNSPAVMTSVNPLLAQIKSQKAPSAGEQIKTDTQFILNNLGVYADAVDRALTAMMSSGQAQSLTQRIMGFGDRALTTMTNQVLAGTVVDTFQGKALRALFLLDSGVAKDQLVKMMNDAIAHPAGESIFTAEARENIQKIRDNKLSQIDKNLDRLEEFKRRYNKLNETIVGKESIKLFRVKSLGVIFFSVLALSLSESSKGSIEDRIALSIPILFAGSSLAGMIEEAYKSVITSEIKANTWKMRAASLGSVAAGLTVIMDISDMFEKVQKKGWVSWSVVLSFAKFSSDTAFALSTINDILLSKNKILAAMGKQGLKFTLLSTATEGIGLGVTRLVGFMSTWQVMVAIVFAQMLYEMWTDNEIQDWCEQTVFGTKSNNHNTMYLTAYDISALVQKQEELLHTAMQIVFNLPLSEEEIKKAEDERRKRQQDINTHFRLKY